MKDSIAFDYEGSKFEFKSHSDNDHVLKVMRDKKSYYELDVLLKLKYLLKKLNKSGVAIDAGAYIGTHTCFFSKFCGLDEVISFEANPRSFLLLKENIAKNGLEESVKAMNLALGECQGTATISFSEETTTNMSAVSVDFQDGSSGNKVEVSTIDKYVERHPALDIALIKVDVEGAEIPVLKGASLTIKKHRPLLSVEVHTTKNLKTVLSILRSYNYKIVDCLGYSPTYIFVPMNAGYLNGRLANKIWILRSYIIGKYGDLSWYLYRLAKLVAKES